MDNSPTPTPSTNDLLREISATDYRSEEVELSLQLQKHLERGDPQPNWDNYPDGTRYYREHCNAMAINPCIFYTDQSPTPNRHPSISYGPPTPRILNCDTKDVNEALDHMTNNVDPARLLQKVIADTVPTTPLSANDVQVGGSHYKDKPIEPWDYIARNGIGYLEGNAIKYLSRWKDKGGIEDIRKAAHYIQKLIELEEERHG